MPETHQETASLVIATVRDFVEREVRPVASIHDHDDTYPEVLIDRMKDLGLFGLTIPERFGGAGVSATVYANVIEELALGWMSLTGALNTHLLLALMIQESGTDEQRERLLPLMADGTLRGVICITEPDAGTDVQAIQTRAVDEGDHYVLTGSKMFITNGRNGDLYGVVCKTDPAADPPYKGISMMLAQKGPGLNVVRDIPKMGYRGIETTELSFDGLRVPKADLLGGVEGQGFRHVMRGLELGRVNVAARAVGVARAALQDSVRYAQTRKTFGKPIAEHQAIQELLADMATDVQAAHLLVANAAGKMERGERADLEAGMAKLFASEACLRVATSAMRVHGGAGYTQDLPIERYFRDAPLMIIGEGTSEIQRQVIARRLIQSYPDGDLLRDSL
jgi:alkylation response protein AidB-like acyl-CoA dehydrogenase